MDMKHIDSIGRVPKTKNRGLTEVSPKLNERWF